jgi:hypothetical protein
MVVQPLTLLHRAVLLKKTAGTRAAAEYLCKWDVPLPIAAMVLCREPMSRRAGKGRQLAAR